MAGGLGDRFPIVEQGCCGTLLGWINVSPLGLNTITKNHSI